MGNILFNWVIRDESESGGGDVQGTRCEAHLVEAANFKNSGDILNEKRINSEDIISKNCKGRQIIVAELIYDGIKIPDVCCRPRGKESTKVQITQKIGIERGNSHWKNDGIYRQTAHTNTLKLH